MGIALRGRQGRRGRIRKPGCDRAERRFDAHFVRRRGGEIAAETGEARYVVHDRQDSGLFRIDERGGLGRQDLAGIARLIEEEVLETIHVAVRRGGCRQEEKRRIERRGAPPEPTNHRPDYTRLVGSV